MDRKDREREQLSTLLANLYPNTVSQDQMAKGFTRLLQFTEVGTPVLTPAVQRLEVSFDYSSLVIVVTSCPNRC